MVVKDAAAAEELASRFLVETMGAGNEPLGIISDKTLRLDSGWLFFFNSIEFIETGNELAALAGNGPIFVGKDGRTAMLPSYLSWQEALERFLHDAPSGSSQHSK